MNAKHTDIDGPDHASCAMCSARVPLTKEHALPKWLAGPTGAADLMVKHKYEGPPGTGVDREWTSKGLGIQINKVCATCNNGWMAQLEGDAQSILQPMIGGNPQMLTGSKSAVLARWFVKTVGMLDLASDHTLRIIPLDLPPLARDVRPKLDKLTIWAAMATYDAGITVGGRLMATQLGESEPAAGWMYAIVLRRLVLVGCGVASGGRPVQLRPQMASAMTKVWAPELVAAFPPRNGLNRKQVPLILHMIAAMAQ